MIFGLKNLVSSNHASKSAHTKRNKQKDKLAVCSNAELQALLHLLWLMSVATDASLGAVGGGENFDEGTLQHVIFDVGCSSEEQRLFHCPFSTDIDRNCGQFEDAWVACQGM